MHCWARSLLYLVITILALGQMIAACGQKGPLYLPDAEPEAARPAANPAAPMPAADAGEAQREARDEVPTPPPTPETL